MRIIRFMTSCILALSILLVSCAHAPPSKAVRTSYGTIGIISPATELKGDFGAPTSGKGAGAAKGGAALVFTPEAVFGEKGTNSDMATRWTTYGVLLFPLFAVGGTVYGAVAAEPREKVKKAEDSINGVLKNIDIQQAMRDGVFNAAKERTSCNVVPILESFTESPLPEGGHAGYRDLKASGIDTALVVEVTEFCFSGAGLKIDPPLSVSIEVKIRLVRCSDGKELYSNTFIYSKGLEMKYKEWAVDGAKPLSDEINWACELLARQIVEETMLGIPHRSAEAELSTLT